MTLTTLRTGCQQGVSLLNQPVIKEGIKNIASAAAFTFGLIEVYDLYKAWRGPPLPTESTSSSPSWIQIADQIILLSAKISLLLSATTSRPALWFFSVLTGRLFSTQQLSGVFGPNATFAVNPWHPRHVVSLAAVILALPGAIQSAHQGWLWICGSVSQQTALTRSKTHLMALINTIGSRPVQHLGNRACRWLLA